MWEYVENYGNWTVKAPVSELTQSAFKSNLNHTSWVNLGKLVSFSKPQLSHLYMGLATNVMWMKTEII